MRYLHIHLVIFIVIWFGLFLDSFEVAEQFYSNFLAISTFIWIYYFTSTSVRQLMIFGLIVAVLGEFLFALAFGMYTYRLENLPIYVPFGHSMAYVSVYYLVKEPLVKQHKKVIENILYILMILYSTFWFLFANDTLGFICMLMILVLFKRFPHTKLFFLLMYFVIVYLELIGTYYECWVWPNIWFDKITFISSANPPSGISVFYFGFDLACLWLYKYYDTKRWKRMKLFRSARLKRV